MAYLRELLGRPIADVSGRQVGTLTDLVATNHPHTAHPQITALSLRCNGHEQVIPVTAVTILIAPVIPLKFGVKNLPSYQCLVEDIFLGREVLDKPIIDINGIRIVKVHDLELTRINNNIYVANVIISSNGQGGRRWRLGLRRQTPSINSISWDNIEFLSGHTPLRLKVPGDKLTDLHPADLADIVSDLARHRQGETIIENLDVPTLADVLEESEPEVQASLVEHISNDKMAEVLEAMASDEAADLLAEMPPARSQAVLNLMEANEAADVRKLLTYPVDTAGGLMTTDFIAVPPDLTAAEAIALLRREGHKAQTLYYIYVTDSDMHLLGVFSLRDLILAEPSTAITEFMHCRVVTVRLEDSQDDVAHVISKYNLLAVPVVDNHNRLHGIVTADDALDKLIPTSWKKRLPRLHR